MGLEDGIIQTWISNCDGCASKKRSTPYQLDKISVDSGKKQSVCQVVTFDMQERTENETGNSSVCRYQGLDFRAYFKPGFDIAQQMALNLEPDGHYRCHKPKTKKK